MADGGILKSNTIESCSEALSGAAKDVDGGTFDSKGGWKTELSNVIESQPDVSLKQESLTDGLRVESKAFDVGSK